MEHERFPEQHLNASLKSESRQDEPDLIIVETIIVEPTKPTMLFTLETTAVMSRRLVPQ